eukprot:g20.t1
MEGKNNSNARRISDSVMGAELEEVLRQRSLTLNDMGLAAILKNRNHDYERPKTSSTATRRKTYNTTVRRPRTSYTSSSSRFSRRKIVTKEKSIASVDPEVHKALTMFNTLIESEERKVKQGTLPHIDIRFYLNRGDVYRKIDAWQQALADYHKAYDIDSNNWEVRTRLSLIHNIFGMDLFNQCQYAHASIEFSTAIGYNSHVAQYYVHRGDAEFYLDNYELAYKNYTKAVELEPNNKGAQNALLKFKKPERSNINVTNRNRLRSKTKPYKFPGICKAGKTADPVFHLYTTQNRRRPVSASMMSLPGQRGRERHWERRKKQLRGYRKNK